MRNQKEPKWITDSAVSMLRDSRKAYGDEDQNDLMSEIDSSDHDMSFGEEDAEPEWLTKAAKSLLLGHKDSYGDEEQNDLMEAINTGHQD